MTARALRNGGFLVFSAAAALAARVPLLSHETYDGRVISSAYGFLVENGYLRAFSYDFHLYNPPYLYLLAGAAWSFPEGPALTVIKVLSIAFDFLLAYFVAQCVRQRYPGSDAAYLLAWAAALLAPAVVVNSALWAQADGVYTAFLLASLYYLRAGRSAPAFLAFGLSFAVKLQAVFLLPLFLWVSRKQRVEWRYLGLSAFVYGATLLPAWFAGRPFHELALTYFRQADHYSSLTERAPNLLVWAPNDWFPFWPVFVALFGGVVWLVDFAVRKSRAVLTADRFWTLALLALLLAPYLLPKMHMRYFYPAAAVAIVFAFCRPRFWPVPVVVGFASFVPYLMEFAFGWPPNATARGGAVVLAAAVALLLRRLWRDLDLRLRPGEVRAHLARRAAEIRPAVLPLLLLGCLAAAVSFAVSEGRFGRPAADDPVAARTLARVGNLSAEHRFVPFTRRALDAEGEVAYSLDGGRPPGADLLLQRVLFHFADGAAAEAAAARAAMAVSFCLAALLAYLSLVRLLGGRWIAVGVTLFAFSSFLGGAWDAVAAEGAPAALAVLLAFHGMVVFVREGRFRQLLLKAGAALFLATAAYALVAAFAVLGLASVLFGRFRGGYAGDSSDGSGGVAGSRRVGAAPAAAASAIGSAGGSPGVSVGVSPVLARRRFGEFLLFCVAVGAALFLFGRANERALSDTGARLIPSPAASPESGAVSPAVSPQSPSGMDSPSGMEGSAGRESPAAGIESPSAARWGRFAASFVPYAFGAYLPEGGVGRLGVGVVPALVGVVLVGVVLVWAAFSRERLLFLPLVLAGLFPWALPGVAASAVSAASVPAHALFVAIAAFALAALALTRRRAERPDRNPGGDSNGDSGRRAAGVPVFVFVLVFVSGAAAVFVVSGHRAGAGEYDAGAAALEARVGADFDRIRRALELRTGEPVVFAPTGPYGSPQAVSRYLPGAVFVVREGQRGLAEFEIASRTDREGPIPDAGLLTPGNSEVFLYLRAAADGGLARMIAAAGPPVVRGEFDLYLHDDRLLYVREDCRPEHREGRFVLHLDPEDPDDLPPERRQYGFENLSFDFDDRALERGGRCVASVRLPEYPIQRVVTGRHPGRSGRDFVWRVEFAPKFSPTR